MKSIIKLKDSEVGDITIVIPKIRDYHKSFSSVVITYENGDRRSIEGNDLNELIRQLDEAIEKYYAG
jgi:hypothetical protein